MKKILLNILLTFLIGVLSAHAVLPHHHHAGNVCLLPIQTHSHNTDCNHDSQTHDSKTHDHENTEHKDLNNCVFSQVLVNQFNIRKIFQQIEASSDIAVILFALAHYNSYNNDFNNSKYYSTANVCPLKHSIFIALCSGLRAPPVK